MDFLYLKRWNWFIKYFNFLPNNVFSDDWIQLIRGLWFHSTRCVKSRCDYRLHQISHPAAKQKLERLYMPIHDNLSKIGVAIQNSSNFALVRWLCGMWNHCSLPNGLWCSVLKSPLSQSDYQEETCEVLKCNPVPVCLLWWKDVPKRARGIFVFLASCLNDTGLGTGCGTDVNVSVLRACFDLVHRYLPMCRTLQLELSILQHSMSLNPSLQLSSLLCLPRFSATP